MIIICAWPNQTNYAKFNLYDYTLVTAITLCCYAYMLCCCNLVLIGRHICFMVNCKSSYAISTMCLSALLVQKLLHPIPTNFLSCPSPKVLVHRYLYECYLCFVLLCMFYGNCAICCVVDICMSVVCLVLLVRFVENVIVVRTRKK